MRPPMKKRLIICKRVSDGTRVGTAEEVLVKLAARDTDELGNS